MRTAGSGSAPASSAEVTLTANWSPAPQVSVVGGSAALAARTSGTGTSGCDPDPTRVAPRSPCVTATVVGDQDSPGRGQRRLDRAGERRVGRPTVAGVQPEHRDAAGTDPGL